MGSCYSSTYKSTASKSVEVDVKGCESAVTTVTQEQRGSGRWKRKKGWGSDGNGFGGEIEIPGRMYSNGSSEVACLYTQQGKKGTNQDAMLVWENFNSRYDTTFCGVFDGHGPFGHMVAKKVRDSLPIILCTQWKANYNNDPNNLCTNQNANGSTNCEESSSPSMDDEWCESLENEKNSKIPEMYQPLKVSMLKAFKLMDKELKLHPTIDCFCSGSTAVTLIKQGQDLIIGNVGDSRAVLATRDKDNSLVSVQLTVDLKPDLPGEAARIQQCKGRVFALQDEPEVARVWLPTSDSPGLAMARAFGDFCLKDFGLISIPDVYHHRIAEKDEFVILATDGVWDVLSNTEAVDIVASAPSRTTAARALVDCATRSWRLKYPTSKNDDCAVVCLFLDHQLAGTELQGTAADGAARNGSGRSCKERRGAESRNRGARKAGLTARGVWSGRPWWECAGGADWRQVLTENGACRGLWCPWIREMVFFFFGRGSEQQLEARRYRRRTETDRARQVVRGSGEWPRGADGSRRQAADRRHGLSRGSR